MRTRRVLRAVTTGLFGLTLAGCAGVSPGFEVTDPGFPALDSQQTYTVRTPTRLWVGDALGMHVLASHDPEIAIAIANGPDESGAFWIGPVPTERRFTAVPEIDD